MLAPCAPWVTEEDLESEDALPCCSGLEPEAVSPWVEVASEVLYRLSGQQFGGVCESTVYPTSCACSQRWGRGSASCSVYPSILLGVTPIVSIDSIVINGAELSDTAYHVDDYTWLVRDDGEPWPCCNDLRVGAERQWSVTVHAGVAPPASGVVAVKALACEYARACAGDSKCRLPRTVSTVTRQGLTIAARAATLEWVTGRGVVFGIPEIDQFIVSYNPNGMVDEPTVLMAGAQAPVSARTWTADG